MSVLIAGCGSNEKQKSLTIGGKAGTEAYILANLAKTLLEEEGFKVETELGVKSVLARQALENEEVDLYYDYTGTAYTVYHKQDNKKIMTDPEKVYDWVKKEDKKQNIIWLKRLKYNNTYTVMIRKEDAQKWGVSSLSDLAAKDDEIKLIFGTDTEFYKRPDGLKALMEEYNLEFKEIKKMQAGLIYKALKEEKIGAGMGYSTDGRISAFGFVNLKDDKNFFPVYNPAPLVRKKVIDEHPEIRDILGKLVNVLTTEKMQDLNGQVDVEHKEAEKVAEEFLKEEGLI